MTIPELLQARERIIKAWAVASEALNEVGAAMSSIRSAKFRICDHERQVDRGYIAPYDFGRRDYPHNIERQTKALDYSLWVFTLDKMNLTNVMSEGAKSDYLEKVRTAGRKFCEEELEGLVQNAVDIFRKNSLNIVREVYGNLIGCGYHSGNWMEKKKDNLQKVEKVFRIWYTNFEHPARRSYSSAGRFDWNDVMTACRLIEGMGPTNYSNNFYSLTNARDRERGDVVETEWFHLQAYMNGNVKCRWKEDKIHVLEKLNAIGSGRENAMPDVMRKRYKPEHFDGDGIPKAEAYFKPSGNKPNSDKDFAFFPTPPDSVARMIEIAGLAEDRTLDVLEPSAGDGAIVAALPTGVRCVAVEFNHHRAKRLRETTAAEVHEADFLHWNPGCEFDRVLMNPPFNDRVEAVHVVRAFKMLSPGGVLVAIIPEGWFTRDDMKSKIFREFIHRNEYKPSEKLPAGTFSRTQVATRIISIRRAS